MFDTASMIPQKAAFDICPGVEIAAIGLGNRQQFTHQ
jgi:hypothetical protein